MGADGLTDCLGIGGQTADIQALFARSFVADGPFRFQYCKSAQPWPLLGFVEALQLIEDVAAARLQPAMILFYGLGE